MIKPQNTRSCGKMILVRLLPRFLSNTVLCTSEDRDQENQTRKLMTNLKPELTIEDAQAWIEENKECLLFLKRNRTVNVETLAQNISNEIQRGHLARGDLNMKDAKDALNYVLNLKQRLVSMILNVLEKEN